MKSFWMYLGAVAVIIGLLQFIPTYEKSNPPTDTQKEIQAPKEVMAIFKRSCYDCHSNETKWPWYANVAPMSWAVRRDVIEGRKALNFSTWNNYSDEKKQELKKQIFRSVILAMPLPQYLWLHPEAKLSSKDKETIRNWASDGKGYIDYDVR
ncbi:MULTISPECIES: heme-binding domain-containing protein [unclassified Nitratiruptor]|uniref:heme-binding domain-containing protein n=1 Tax=unclassified Nitratiruptor TaxID=2624044 RepID=UPI001916250D|nr:MULTISPECIES: heme-binding domain-containing protein [unclassified Nitratiruptor]